MVVPNRRDVTILKVGRHAPYEKLKITLNRSNGSINSNNDNGDDDDDDIRCQSIKQIAT